MPRPSDTFSFTSNLVRVTEGGRRPHVSFYQAEYTIDSQGLRRIERIRYLGWRVATQNERTTIRNYRPSIIVQSKKKVAFANYSNVKDLDRLPRPRPIRPGPRYTGPPKSPIQKARFTVTYLDKTTLTTRRVLYRFYDKKSLQRFQRLERSGRLPIPLSGDSVDYGLRAWEYRIRAFRSRSRRYGS